jgi:hypothetical protein
MGGIICLPTRKANEETESGESEGEVGDEESEEWGGGVADEEEELQESLEGKMEKQGDDTSKILADKSTKDETIALETSLQRIAIS